MSFCSIGTRNGSHDAHQRYLTVTAVELRSRLQCWLSNLLYHGWAPHNRIYDSAQEGALLFPLAWIRLEPTGKL